MQTKEDKEYLLRNGFGPFVFPIKGKGIPPNYNWLEKKINDTLVSYIFHNNVLLSIEIFISLKHADTSSIFQLLSNQGFERRQAEKGYDTEYINNKAGIQYKVSIYPRNIKFVNTISLRKGPIPPMDSVSMKP